MSSKIGQAAMEYLMTYGWALLVIVAVIAILLVINPFASPQSCKFDQVGFLCSNPVIATDGKLYMKVTNANNNAVNITKIICTTNKSNTPPTLGSTSSSVLVRKNDVLEISTLGVVCSGGNFAAGSEFSGKVWVFYRNEEDDPSYPLRTASAVITTKVVAASSSSNPSIPTGGTSSSS